MKPARQADLFGDAGVVVQRWATFSPCAEHGWACAVPSCAGRPWRYDLGRVWDEAKRVLLAILLNPSTADADVNDPTVAKMEAWAGMWGYGGLVVCNMYAFRATDPRVMKRAADPVGPDNDATIDRWAAQAGLIVCGWGANAGPNAPGWPKGSPHRERAAMVVARLLARGIQLHALHVTGGGEPGHPLYLPNATRPEPWQPAARTAGA